MKVDTIICKCGHSKYEHRNEEEDDEEVDDTFCFYESCACQRYEPIEVEQKLTLGGKG